MVSINRDIELKNDRGVISCLFTGGNVIPPSSFIDQKTCLRIHYHRESSPVIDFKSDDDNSRHIRMKNKFEFEF